MHQPTDPHQHSEGHTRSPEARAALIEEGLQARPPLPPIERLRELDRQLRAELDVLTPIVQKQADRMWRGDPDWYSCQRTLDAAAATLTEDLGAGLASAAQHVDKLARCLRDLDSYTTGART
ncbi:DUF6415 family natural product biosynthesis protein [Streptomyces sp. E11-3]|uniref:DUF6415 family natural product biosynthesis protein n=1 Tax=Streptomyces sp. E11-3 TaxID=3110112 RepID=UPI0039803050